LDAVASEADDAKKPSDSIRTLGEGGEGILPEIHPGAGGAEASSPAVNVIDLLTDSERLT
jgi:hypothetical protein